jgi:hypothetical protein
MGKFPNVDHLFSIRGVDNKTMERSHESSLHPFHLIVHFRIILGTLKLVALYAATITTHIFCLHSIVPKRRSFLEEWRTMQAQAALLYVTWWRRRSGPYDQLRSDTLSKYHVTRFTRPLKEPKRSKHPTLLSTSDSALFWSLSPPSEVETPQLETLCSNCSELSESSTRSK